MIYFTPNPLFDWVIILVLLWLFLKTAKARRDRRQERLEANRAQIQENMQAIKENYRKIRFEDKIAILSVIVVFVLAALALWFFLG